MPYYGDLNPATTPYMSWQVTTAACVYGTGEFYEVKCHEGPISRLHVSYDDCLLVSAGEDGSVVLMDIRDKELAKVSTRQQQVRPASNKAPVHKACAVVACASSHSGVWAGCCQCAAANQTSRAKPTCHAEACCLCASI